MKQKIAHYNAENGTISTSSQGAFPMKNVEVLSEDGEFGGQRGEGLGAAGIDLCITLAKF